MKNTEILKGIKNRCSGEINLGVVGPVRTGKSTFIKKVIENLVVPNIKDEYEKKRCLDEIPQSAQGKTIMTTEPKFVPSKGATITIDNFSTNIRLVDCVGYIIPESKGYEDDSGPRMVKTPWYNEEIPFIEAAEIGTEKVIKDHSTIGIVITTDGSFGEIERKNYIEAEEKVISELKEYGKPFIVILNTIKQDSNTDTILKEMKEKYEVPVMSMNIDKMNEKDLYEILKEALYEFPINEVDVTIPDWVACLSPSNWLKKAYIEKIKESVVSVKKLRDAEDITKHFIDSEYISNSYLSEVEADTGNVMITLESSDELYNQILNEIIDIDMSNKTEVLKLFQDYKEIKEEYGQISSALKMVKKTGYGVSTPTIYDMKLQKPEIVKQGSRYGVRLKAIAPAIHMIRVDVESTFEPIIGSELQSKELINYLMKDYDKDPNNIWKSEIFGRSLDELVKEGIQAKISLMPDNIRYKLQQTLTKLVNKGSGNLFAIVI